MPTITSFEQAQSYLFGTINETLSRRSPGRLDRMRAFLRNLGDPQNAYPTIQVGGTSGKGSTASMLAAVLIAAGHRTGLHTKPHLNSMTERARVDHANVAEERFAELLDEMMPAIERTTAEIGRPSYYETLLALTLLHFARERVDIAVVEVGIGGALDGTNVLVPGLCIITNVGLDHTEILGDTLETIARDKVGIAKSGVPLVSDAREPIVRATIAAGCRAAGAPLVFVDERAQIAPTRAEPYTNAFTVATERATYAIGLSLLGQFQRRNAATAIVALELLGERFRPSAAAVEAGLAQVLIPGRMEYFPAYPGVVFDIAHNPDKARHLAEALAETFPGQRFAFVVAIGESKDATNVLAPLLALPASFVFTSFSTVGRTAIRPQRLVNVAEDAGVWARAIEDPIEALSVARRSAGPDTIVVVTGSTFVVAVIRKWWLNDVAERSRN
ncbi:MAG: bifunctional folylpolyglutamate synthase/dihydrofolate synthase [Vulcanimicrobiaceae bacterium]